MTYVDDLLPGFLLVGVGLGFSFVPVSIAALAGVAGREAGLASGLINTSQQIGGALGLAILATVSTTRTDNLTPSGEQPSLQASWTVTAPPFGWRPASPPSRSRSRSSYSSARISSRPRRRTHRRRRADAQENVTSGPSTSAAPRRQARRESASARTAQPYRSNPCRSSARRAPSRASGSRRPSCSVESRRTAGRER